MKTNKQAAAQLLIDLNKSMQSPGQKELMKNFYGGVRLRPVPLRIAKGVDRE